MILHRQDHGRLPVPNIALIQITPGDGCCKSCVGSNVPGLSAHGRGVVQCIDQAQIRTFGVDRVHSHGVGFHQLRHHMQNLQEDSVRRQNHQPLNQAVQLGNALLGIQKTFFVFVFDHNVLRIDCFQFTEVIGHHLVAAACITHFFTQHIHRIANRHTEEHELHHGENALSVRIEVGHFQQTQIPGGQISARSQNDSQRALPQTIEQGNEHHIDQHPVDL